jgi:hypothetical protein
MLLGFRLLYKDAAGGYLSGEEIVFVNDLLSDTSQCDRSGNPSRWKFPLSLQTIIALKPVAISALVALVVVILIYRTREPYQTPAPEQTRSAQLPSKGLPAPPPSPNLAPPPSLAPPDEPFQRPVDYQRRLSELGYYMGRADGIWGPKSRAALRAYKVANGLPTNVEWDDITAERLFAPRQLWPSANAQ